MLKPTDTYYFNKPNPIKSCLLALRDILLEQDEAISETVKYGMPCFCYKNKQFCYLWTDKKTNYPYLLLVEGQHINHPALESGSRKRMKILNINPNKDLPIDTINAVLKAALDLYRDGVIAIK